MIHYPYIYIDIENTIISMSCYAKLRFFMSQKLCNSRSSSRLAEHVSVSPVGYIYRGRKIPPRCARSGIGQVDVVCDAKSDGLTLSKGAEIVFLAAKVS